MYNSMPSSQRGLNQSFRLDAFGIALVRTWSSFVRFNPAAFSIEASSIIAKPMINATTGLTRCAGSGSPSPRACKKDVVPIKFVD